MSLVVYLSNTQVQILSGSAKGKSVGVDKVYTMPVPEGCILNGVITDAGTLSSAMQEFWKTNKLPKKGIKLIVTNPHFAVRMQDIPLQSQKKSEKFLKRELADEEKNQIIGFYEISKNNKLKSQKICAEIAEQNLIQDYEQLFKAAGLELSTINSGIGMTVNFLLQTGTVTNKTCIVMNLDGNTITSVFFVKGDYYYSTSRRIFNDIGTDGFARDMAATVNQIDQFARSQRIEETISDIYFAGMSEDNANLCSATIREGMTGDINIQRLSNLINVKISGGGYTINELLYPVAGLSNVKNQLNILSQVNENLNKEASEKPNILKIVIPYAITAVIMVIATVIVGRMNANKTKELKEMQSYIKDPYNISEEMKYDEAAAKAGSYGKHYGSLYLMRQNIDSYPWANSSIIRVVERAAKGLADVTIISYDSNSGVINMTATAAKENQVNRFIEKLMKDKSFESVNYTGYAKTDAEGGRYTIKFTCILSEIAGKTDEEIEKEKAALGKESPSSENEESADSEDSSEEVDEGEESSSEEATSEDTSSSSESSSESEVVE